MDLTVRFKALIHMHVILICNYLFDSKIWLFWTILYNFNHFGPDQNVLDGHSFKNEGCLRILAELL